MILVAREDLFTKHLLFGLVDLVARRTYLSNIFDIINLNFSFLVALFTKHLLFGMVDLVARKTYSLNFSILA